MTVLPRTSPELAALWDALDAWAEWCEDKLLVGKSLTLYDAYRAAVAATTERTTMPDKIEIDADVARPFVEWVNKRKITFIPENATLAAVYDALTAALAKLRPLPAEPPVGSRYRALIAEVPDENLRRVLSGLVTLLTEKTYMQHDGHYVMRVLGDAGFVKFACENQGYGRIVGEYPTKDGE